MKLVVAIGCVLLLALLVHDRNRWKAKTGHYAELLAGERAAHSATVANYRLAAERARQADAENAAKVRAAQAGINKRSVHEFESRLAAARAVAGRMHRSHESAAVDPGRRGAPPMPGLPLASRDVAQATGENRLPDADRLIATEQAIQLDELIKWVRRQAEVEVDRR